MNFKINFSVHTLILNGKLIANEKEQWDSDSDRERGGRAQRSVVRPHSLLCSRHMGPAPSPLHAVVHVALTTSPGGRQYYYSIFTDEKAES